MIGKKAEKKKKSLTDLVDGYPADDQQSDDDGTPLHSDGLSPHACTANGHASCANVRIRAARHMYFYIA